jgi:DNA-binding transcriptional LysR family regulator
VLAEAEAAEAVATDQLLEPRGRLRVTMPVHFGRHCAAPVLLAFAQRYPALNLDLSFNDRVVDLAEDGYDLAIRTGELQDRAGVTVRRVARQRMVVCASPAYLDRNGRPAQLEDIAGHQGVLYWRSGAVAPWQFPRPGQPPAEVTPLARFRFDDLDAIADAAAAGLGLAWLPSWLVRERLLSGTLVTLLTDLPEFPYDSYALWLSTPRLPLKIRLAIDSLATGLPRLMDRE